MSEIKERVIEIIVDELGVDREEVNMDSKFTQDLGADSLDTVELIMKFEREFDVEIPDSEAEKINTVGDAVDFITKLS